LNVHGVCRVDIDHATNFTQVQPALLEERLTIGLPNPFCFKPMSFCFVTYQFDRYHIDVDGLELSHDGLPIKLQPQAFVLLVFLIENRERVVTKDEIISQVWQARAVSDATLNTRINAIRRALGDSGEAQAVIKTFPRRGFRFIADMANTNQSSNRGMATSPPQESATSRPSITVLPFANIGGNPDEEFFADGITEELVMALSKIRGFFVTDRSTTFSLKGSKEGTGDIAALIGVRYVLQGSVRTSGGRIRVGAQLTDAESGVQIWSERYDRALDDIFAIQDEVTASLVGCLAPELYAAEHARLIRRKPQSLDAWECFIHALHLYGQQSRSGSEKALELLEQAISLDTDYSQALGLYATILTWRAIQRWEPFETSIEKARIAADRAILADTNDPWASIGKGYVSTASRDSGAAIMNYGRAVDLSPNFAYAHALLGVANAYAGNGALATSHIDTAFRLSPRDTFIDKFYLYRAVASFQIGHYSAAIEAACAAIELKPEHASSHMFLAASYALVGQQELAEAAMSGFVALVPSAKASTIESAIAYVDVKDRKRIANALRAAGLD
jgi:TolB-like protein/Flp pilus assembly protein TadD